MTLEQIYYRYSSLLGEVDKLNVTENEVFVYFYVTIKI